jgi:hypothetical protein
MKIIVKNRNHCGHKKRKQKENRRHSGTRRKGRGPAPFLALLGS